MPAPGNSGARLLGKKARKRAFFILGPACGGAGFLAYLAGMNKLANLFLVGPMGAGKTTIGRQLARALGWTFHDVDREIETRSGADIPLIFDLEGEAGFRIRERAVLEELTGLQGVVVATGGGAVLDPLNRDHLTRRGRVIYLHASVAQQLKRTARDRHRPLLHTRDRRLRLEELMAVREPLYQAVAELTVDTDGRTVRAVAGDILQRLGLESCVPPRRPRTVRPKA